MASQLPHKHNLRHDAGGDAAFIVRGGRMTGIGWCPPFLSLELCNYPSNAEFNLYTITPEVLRAVADDLDIGRQPKLTPWRQNY